MIIATGIPIREGMSKSVHGMRLRCRYACSAQLRTQGLRRREKAHGDYAEKSYAGPSNKLGDAKCPVVPEHGYLHVLQHIPYDGRRR